MSTQTIQQEIPSGTHAVDRVHSSVAFAVKHAGVATFRGDFESFEARLTGGESPSLEGAVDVSSIRVADEQLKGHLLSPEFFDAGEHSKLSFESSELEVAGDGAVALRGVLTIAGRSREVTASGRAGRIGSYLDGKPHIGLSLAASVDRRDFGLDWQAELPSGGEALDWQVEISVELQFVPEGE
ncbi:MAG TPA: YceI family protein [Solirubrobacterales bacterium]|nr:YceI family protein [Solirubrobacterales bacterium]